MATLTTHSAGQTRDLGESWGATAQSGWVLGLLGGLGAGKTCLVQGLAKGLGITERVHSPTFALLNEYATGRLPLYHLDLYRLSTPAAIAGAGLDEYLRPASGIAVVEWIGHWLGFPDPEESAVGDILPKLMSAARSLLPPSFRLVWLETVSENERNIHYADSGA